MLRQLQKAWWGVNTPYSAIPVQLKAPACWTTRQMLPILRDLPRGCLQLQHAGTLQGRAFTVANGVGWVAKRGPPLIMYIKGGVSNV